MADEQSFADELGAVIAQVEAAVTRAEEIAALRASKGRSLGAGALEGLGHLDDRLRKLQSSIRTLCGVDDTLQRELERERERFNALADRR
jgi:hypothetical protein